GVPVLLFQHGAVYNGGVSPTPHDLPHDIGGTPKDFDHYLAAHAPGKGPLTGWGPTPPPPSLGNPCRSPPTAGPRPPAAPAELGVRQPRVEGQCQRPLECLVGARNRRLVAISREPVQGIGADLRLDPGCTQPCQHLVPAIDSDHVRLPAVPIALRRLGDADD